MVRRKMKTTTFNNIYFLDDIQKRKRRLKKKLRVAEKSIIKEVDFGKSFFSSERRLSSLFDDIEGDSTREIIGYLLPLGLKYVLKQIKKSPNKKLYKRLLIYTVLGSLSALMVYKYMANGDKKNEK
jgi:hypothetical protein